MAANENFFKTNTESKIFLHWSLHLILIYECRFIVSDDLIENKDINDSEVFGDEDDEEGVKEKKKHEELLKEIDSSK